MQSIIVYNEISLSFYGVSDYERSAFRDENHNHVITRELRLITITKLIRLLRKRLNTVNLTRSQIPSIIVNVILLLIPVLTIV